MKHKVSELEGALLDAAVAKAEGKEVHKSTFEYSDTCWIVGIGTQGIIPYEPSSSWPYGGPIIERERLMVEPRLRNGVWYGEWRSVGLSWKGRQHADETGPTPLIAAMRAYVASRFGDEMELP